MTDKIVRTVCGDVDPNDLGLTTAHEHLIGNMELLSRVQAMYKEMIPEDMLKARPENLAFLRSGTALFSDDCNVCNDYDWLVSELGYFRDKVSGGCIVDASPIGMRGDTRLMRKASQETDVKIVTTTGLYYATARPEGYEHLSESEVYDLCSKEVREGIEGSEDENGVRVYPGFVKCGLTGVADGEDIPQCEMDTVAALARIAGETGLSLHIHTSKPMNEKRIVGVAQFALDYGCPPDRLNMMHLDQYLRYPWDIAEYERDFDCPRTVKIDLQREILQMGCYIGFDSWGSQVFVVSDNYDRTKGIVKLLNEGYGDHIVLGHDIYERSRSCALGDWGFSDFALNLIPKLYEFADLIDTDDIDKLIYDNPANLLAFDPDGVK